MKYRELPWQIPHRGEVRFSLKSSDLSLRQIRQTTLLKVRALILGLFQNRVLNKYKGFFFLFYFVKR